MCKAATELQELKLTSDGKHKSFDIGDYIYTCNCYITLVTFKTRLDSVQNVWLPRQDQLQDMVINNPYTGLLNMGFFFADFFYDVSTDNNGDPLDSLKFTSMEQLWLAFVMNDKYNKSWEDGVWK